MNIDPTNFPLRAPCKCGHESGYITARNGQDTVRCLSCNSHCYNAPRVETGRAVRSITTVHNGVRPQLRSRVLERDGFTCVLCRTTTAPLHVGHLVSVDSGVAFGLTDSEINDEENLVAMCEECNLGYGACPIPLRTAVALIRARISWRNRSQR